MKDNKGFWDRWAGRYDRFMSGDKDTYARILDRMKKKLNRNMDVLELACGTGILSVQLAGNVKMLEAADFSEEMIKQAKQKCHSSRLHFFVQDATALPYAPETFDAVIISNALHIMPSKGAGGNQAGVKTGRDFDRADIYGGRKRVWTFKDTNHGAFRF